ncbi:MAG: YnbE family lipoprotein [Proteobacteria bacterium]|nr:YnbE family lipoprotein [Pseudomonadota bacterium]
MPLSRISGKKRPAVRLVLAAFACLTLFACEPTVKLEAPKEPITINLNIKIDAEVRVKLEEAAKEDIETNPGVF